ncbi:MAG TPA: efflux RND transporter periplasmic adaptor subunit [Gammaproteobacteria bacterium]|nr:efflux RND transporter periplasmic adaptor subunit [Gammaproteobacteria bacterium]
MKKSFPIRPAIVLSVIVLLCIYIWLSTKPTVHNAPKKGGFNKTFVVQVTRPIIKPVPVTLDEVGTVEAEETVSIIPQASGILKSIHVAQGQNVQAGELLFEIDPAVYLTAVAQAKANLERDQAQLALLNANAERYAALAKLEYVTRQQSDEAQAAASAQKAAVAADQAQLNQANIQLGYTQIRAPISGKAGAITVHQGDLISANNASPLLVINRLDPVLIDFSISQNQLPDLLHYQKAGTLKVKIIKESGSDVLGRGELSFINNNVNPQTGTVQIKAKAPNTDFALWPGQLVTVRLFLTTEPKALVIPENAVQLGQNGNFVYLLKQGKAVVQPVTVSRQIKHQAVIAKGLGGNEAVITEIPPGLSDGTLVQVADGLASKSTEKT